MLFIIPLASTGVTGTLTKVIGIPMENTGKHCYTTVIPETFSMGIFLST